MPLTYITGDSFLEVYTDAARKLLSPSYAVKRCPRSIETYEMPGETVLEIKDPASSLAYHPQRKFSLPYAVCESLLLFVDIDNLKAFTAINPKMSEYSDDGETLRGAYGPRFVSALPLAIKKLKSDHDTRQAVINIFDASYDLKQQTKDVPCTLSISFAIRNNGKLDATVHMRSNDAVMGLPYDVYNFTNAQQVIANTLDIDVGTYTHIVDSLHLYSSDASFFSQLFEPGQDARWESVPNRNHCDLDSWQLQAMDYMMCIANLSDSSTPLTPAQTSKCFAKRVDKDFYSHFCKCEVAYRKHIDPDYFSFMVGRPALVNLFTFPGFRNFVNRWRTYAR